MSNKIVPTIYRSVIDEVISAIKPEFDEYGVDENVLADLQQKWQNKVIASHVAQFEPPNAAQPPPAQPHHPPYPPHPIQHMHPHYPQTYPQQPPGPPGPSVNSQPHIKSEPTESRYPLSGPYALPPLPGPQLNGARPGGQQGVFSFPPSSPATSQQAPKIPQVDGPSSSSSDSPSPPSSQSFAPHSSHPSLAQPSQSSTSAQDDEEAINSDLDDSTTEDEEDADDGGAGETDIVFCTYDKDLMTKPKVARVKNKWKCVLKDGMIHVNGRDYLFAKCTGEFEW